MQIKIKREDGTKVKINTRALKTGHRVSIIAWNVKTSEIGRTHHDYPDFLAAYDAAVRISKELES